MYLKQGITVAKFQLKHGAFQWIFIYFKAVLYNDIYKEYSIEFNKDPTSKPCQKLRHDYTSLPKLFEYFGDIHQYWLEKDGYPCFDQMFTKWKSDNTDKLMLFLTGISPYKVVHAGEAIVPDEYDVIYAIPKSYDIQSYETNFAKILDRAHETFNQDWFQTLPVSLYRTKMIGGGGGNDEYNSISGFRGKIFATERRVDAYIWMHGMDKGLGECVKLAAKSGLRCWSKIVTEWTEYANAENTEIENLNLEPTPTETKKMSKLALEGAQVIKNTILGYFPSPKKIPPT